jgi:hypothetical protein
MNKLVKIIDNLQDQSMVNRIMEMAERLDISMTPIQIENFVLNDIEHPTPYGKYIQTQQELKHRLNLLIDFYYQIKETELEIEKKERDINKTEDDLDKKILELHKEKLQLKLLSFENEVKKVLKETRVFYSLYEKHPEFHELSEEDKFKLEAENWAKKTLNMPLVFEERYGEGYMEKALGIENYQAFKELRKKGFGLLPREIFEVKKITQQGG